MDFGKRKTQPVIYRQTVKVPVSKSASPAPQRPSSARPDPNRYAAALARPSAKSHLSRKPPNPAKRAVSSARGVKRKSATPQPVWSSDDEDDSGDVGGSDSDASRKRIKSSVSSVESSGPRRPIVSEKTFKVDTVFDIIHGAQTTSGEQAAKFKNPWEDDDFVTVKLKYPSGQLEKFELKIPTNGSGDDYKPMEDIKETMKAVCKYYLPEELPATFTMEEDDYERQLQRAWQREDAEGWASVVEKFNDMVQRFLDDGAIHKHLLTRSTLDLDWVKRILEQVYSRTVSPKVETLRRYTNGSDNVYGELLPRFCSKVFNQTKLNHEHVFVDLGSGVGNVVLQAALEVGCESWGIEMMKNPCDLAELQAKEFPARTGLWGLSTGKVKLIRGDFTDNPQIDEVLRRADVVLINNQAFTPDLNNILRDKFLDLKDGCQVVSLKPFVPNGHRISTRNFDSVVNLLIQRKYEYFSENVSWTDGGGHYYIARKDAGPLRAFKKKHGIP